MYVELNHRESEMDVESSHRDREVQVDAGHSCSGVPIYSDYSPDQRDRHQTSFRFAAYRHATVCVIMLLPPSPLPSMRSPPPTAALGEKYQGSAIG